MKLTWRIDLKKVEVWILHLTVLIIIVIILKKNNFLFVQKSSKSIISKWLMILEQERTAHSLLFSDKWYAHPSCACCRLYSPIITENYNIFDIYLYFKQQTALQGMKLQLIKHNHLLTIQQVRPNKVYVS